MTAMNQDAQIIQRLGGPSEVARRLGYEVKNRGAQRVHNWLKRGIPSAVKVKHPELFMPELATDHLQAELIEKAQA